MKIKRSPKKTPPSTLQLAAFIQEITKADQDDLPSILNTVINTGWTWPRTDLQHWIVPLNRFDDILESVIRDYDLEGMEHGQRNQFTPRTRTLLLAILAFEKILLENSTNRKIFSSFDRLNDLLQTTDIQVLLATLRLSLRPAQQYSSTPSSSGISPFGIAEKRLLNLAQPWGTRDWGIDMVDLAGESVNFPPEAEAAMEELEWQFYKKGAGPGKTTTGEGEASGVEKKEGAADQMEVEDDTTGTSVVGPSSTILGTPRPRATFPPSSSLATPIPSTPTPNPLHPASTSSLTSPSSEGLTTVHIALNRSSTSTTAPNRAIDLLIDAVESHSIPEPDRLNLLQRIRISQSLPTTSQRREMLLVRLLAIAVFAHTTFESTIQTKLFLFEPELILQLAELVHPDRKEVPVEIQAASFYALDALARFKSKVGEVASALNASVSHGILMYVVRRTLGDLARDDPISTPDFIDSLFNLLSFFQTSSFVGNMIVGAGIVPLLVDFVKIARRDRVSTVTRAVTFLDSLMYGYTSAFNLFISILGLPVFVERVRDEIEISVKSHEAEAKANGGMVDSPTGLLSFDQAALLKALLRALQRLMQTAGTTEGLRNLIDTTLLASVKSIIQNRAIFGPQLLGLAINITATFIHNEPTCLTTIQEAQIPDALYDAIEDSIPASIDVLQAIPNAIGALCLNPAGLTQFNSRPIIAKYFSIFSSERHVRILVDRDNSNMIGASIDELMRHHPSLKDGVLGAVMDALRAIRKLGEEFVPEKGEGYVLLARKENPVGGEGEGSVSVDAPATGDAVMEDAGTGATGPASSSTAKSEDYKDNIVMSSVDVIGRFLEGLFQNLSHCKDFVKLDPFPVLLDIFTLPCAPALTSHTPAFSATSSIFRLMIEVKSTEVVSAVLKQVKKYLEKTKPVWKAQDKSSVISQLLSPTPESLDSQNKLFRPLTNLLTMLAFLSDMYGNLSYSHGRVATSVLIALAQPSEAQTLSDIGQVYRFCLAEQIGLKKLGVAKSTTGMSSTPAIGVVSPVIPGDLGVERSSEESAKGKGKEAETAGAAPTNHKAVLDVVSQIPLNIVPLLQAAVKLFVHRRSSDSSHRKASTEVAKAVAAIMVENLKWPDVSELDDNLAYSTLMISSTSNLLFDERSSSSGLQTLLLVAFQNAGGIEAFLNLFGKYESIASKLLEESSDDNFSVALPVVHTFGGIKLALDLLLRLSNQRTILESPQTGLLLSREKDKSSADYFAPNEAIIKLRSAILPVLSQTWEVSWLRKSPPNVVRNLLVTLVNILRADGEAPAETPASRDLHDHLDSTGAGGILSRALAAASGHVPPPAPVVDETRITQLVEMGFPRAAARTALIRCRNNVPVATEYLLQHPDIVGAARVAEEEAILNAPEGGNEAVPQGGVEAAPPEAAAAAPAEGGDRMEVAEHAAPAPAPEGSASELPLGANQPWETPAADVEMAEEAPSASTSAAVAEPPASTSTSIPSTEAKSEEAQREVALRESKAKLDEGREKLKATFLSNALTLAEDYPELVFEIKGAYELLYPGKGKGKDVTDLSFRPLLDDFATRTSATDSNEQAAATRFRVLALLCSDPIFKSAVESGREELMALVIRYQQEYAKLSPAKDARPKWLPTVMLVADALFSQSELPTPTKILSEGVEVPSVELASQGPAWVEERRGFFDLAMDILAKGVSERGVLISTLRLILILTRNHDLAVAFVERDGLKNLFTILHACEKETEGCHSYAVIIIRHVVEESSLLRPMMEREIESWFSQSRSKVAEVTAFLRGVSSLAFRNTPIFLEATKATCKLAQADAPGTYHVGLIKDPQPQKKPTEAESTIKSPLHQEGASVANPEGGAQPSDAPQPTKAGSKELPLAPPSVEVAIHYLMTEIMETSKLAVVPSPASPKSSSEPAIRTTSTDSQGSSIPALVPDTSAPSAEESADSKDDDKIAPELPHHFHTAFALSTLSELLSSYSICKTSFFTFSTRKSKEGNPAGTLTAAKSKSSFLYFLLNDLIPTGTLTPASDSASRRRSTLSMWASLVIVALCSDPEASTQSKDSAVDITQVRKGVLDAIARAFKEATASNEPTDVRYGRLYALSDLCYRLLASRAYPGLGRLHDDTTMQLAKLMLEKNFAVILTNALADVDLNFPSVSNLINGILRPLEQLTKVVTKVGRAKTAAPVPTGALDADSSDGSSMDDDEEEETDDEEDEELDAPDLYRNSALGMYEGELETGHDAYMSSGSTEEYDEDDDMMDEMDDGVVPGSDISDMSDDEEEVAEFEQAMADIIGSDDEETGSEGIDEETEGEDSDLGEDDELEVHEEMDGEVLDLGGDENDDLDGWVDEELQDGDENGELGDGELFEPVAAIGHIADEDDGDSEGDSILDEEEEHLLNGELEFDPDMTDQLGGHPGDPGTGWDALLNTHGRRPRNFGLEDMMLGGGAGAGAGGGIFRSRIGQGPPITPDHPLLIDAPGSDAQQSSLSRRRRTAGQPGSGSPEYEAWARSLEQVIGTGAIEALHDMLSRNGLGHLSGPDQIRLHMVPGSEGGLALLIDPSAAGLTNPAGAGGLPGVIPAPGHRHSRHHHSTSSRTHRSRSSMIDRFSTSILVPVMTVPRWGEEARVASGILPAERVARLTNYVINILHPAARVVARQAREEEEERRAKAEKEAADEAKKEEERLAELRRIADEKKAAEAEAGRIAAEAEAEAARIAAPPVADTPMEDDLAQVMSLARSLAAGFGARTTSGSNVAAPVEPEGAATDSMMTEDDEDEENDEDEDQDDDEDDEDDEAPEASGSGGASGGDRVMVLINGEEVDITDTGIDPTFLEALPDDMREEVLNQHFRETRSSGPPPAVPSNINSEFLDALPPDLRAEVLRQEAAEQRRADSRAQAAARAQGEGADGQAAPPAPAGPAEIDPATFLASLDPHLRQAVLLDQEDDVLANLPPNLLAEANAIREQGQRRAAARAQVLAGAGGGLPPGSALANLAALANAPLQRKPIIHREAIQLLDKSGLATLVRLLFFPQPLKKNSLQKVLNNLCENTRTRTDLINLLLTILQDGTRDVSAVDKSFSQMSLRASKGAAGGTGAGAKDTPRRKVGLETPGGALPQFPGESVPNLIAHRCLEALTFLVSQNSQAPLFFLTEQESVLGLNRRSSKKGKGKEKTAPSTVFPITILLGLLSRPALLKTQSMMESLTQLLASITKSLSVLSKKPISDAEVPVIAPPPTGTPSATAAPGATTGTESAGGASSAPEGSTSGTAGAAATASETKEEPTLSEILVKNPPQIPGPILRLVVNILDAGECSSKTFQQTLSLIQNLSFLPLARDNILEELQSRAQQLATLLVKDLDELMDASTRSEEEVRTVTLQRFSPASSLQAKLLRLLKVVESASPPVKPTSPSASGGEDQGEKIHQIFLGLEFGDLWARLSDCLTAMEDLSTNTSLVLLPSIESLMVLTGGIGVNV
ncbi:hypothetical protein T439DRAFT_311132 [Meredithblackwellia eburnea MCA 4105]